VRLSGIRDAHHLRELTRAYEQDNQQWAEAMRLFLIDTNRAVATAGGALDEARQQERRRRYRDILRRGEQESPPPQRPAGKKGRLKKSTSRNLLERLLKYEDEVLRFITEESVPFTNNLGENDIRMTKVHQKISGCFRSTEGAEMFCAIRSYLSSCRKQGVSASSALSLLFSGHLPDCFVTCAE